MQMQSRKIWPNEFYFIVNSICLKYCTEKIGSQNGNLALDI